MARADLAFALQFGVGGQSLAFDGTTWTSHLDLADLAVDDVFVRLETARAGAGTVAFDDLAGAGPD